MNSPNPFPAFSRPDSSLAKAGVNGTLCVLVLDESGSMSGFTNDTIGGVNQFIESQKKDKDNTKISIVKFEGGNVTKPFLSIPVENMPLFTNGHYCPRGSTNLNDALGQTISETNLYIQSLPENERPSVIIQVMTDGEENSSREYKKETVKKLVEEAQKSDWIFTFVGADIDSFAVSSALGFSRSATANYGKGNTLETYGMLSDSVTRMKSMRSAGLDNHAIYASGAVFTAEEKKKVSE